jgi:transposase
MEESSLTQLLAQGLSVEKIAQRFGKHPSTVSYWMKKYELVAPNREKHAAKGGIARERLEELVQAGRTIAEIGAELELGKATVRYWLRKYGLRTAAARRAEAGAEARAAGMLTVIRTCRRHGEVEFVVEGRGYYRCKRCRLEQVASHRRALKATLVEEAGGRCRLCGYDRCVAALEFHHLDPMQKRIGISAGGLGLSISVLRTETAKCVLLCSNCHAEVENGVSVIPEESEVSVTVQSGVSGIHVE